MRLVAAVIVLVLALTPGTPPRAAEWSAAELAVLRSLWIGSLPAPPPDPGDRVADDPRAADLGHRLFFDTRLSANGRIACASCHQPARAFTDGRRTAEGVGRLIRNAPSVIGAAWSPWLFWDGRKDSLWSQALAPLESPAEHGMSREAVISVLRADADYRRRYAALFGALPGADDAAGITRAFANIGKAIEAYERKLRPGPSRFDRYVAAVLKGAEPAARDRLTVEESEGLHVFIDPARGNCIRCHKGPLFTDGLFHDIGIDDGANGPSPGDSLQGRPAGFRAALLDPFNCLGAYSDAPGTSCHDLKGAGAASNVLGAFKTPGLRNVARTAPYMHTGQFPDLNAVMQHYRNRPEARIGETELDRLTISDGEFAEIEAFLHSLDSPVEAPVRYLRPPAAE
jgi:cytochrome c peroxidase